MWSNVLEYTKIYLYGALLEKILEFTFRVEFMDLVTSPNVLPSDKDIRDGSLPGLSLQFILKLSTFFMLVKFNGGVILVQLVK